MDVKKVEWLILSTASWVRIIFPGLSFFYEGTAIIFLTSFGEMIWDNVGWELGLRLALLLVSIPPSCFPLFALKKDSNTQEINKLDVATYNTMMIFASVINSSCILIVSFYFFRRTRRNIAGPVPPPTCENDRWVIITGANTGIGRETARQLASRGATVVLACRSLERAQQAVTDIQASLMKSSSKSIWIRLLQVIGINIFQSNITNPTNPAKMYVLQLDLSNFTSIRDAVQTLLSMPEFQNRKIDILINNAGVMFAKKHTSVDGFEMCLQANHLGHFLLTQLLLPHMHHDTNSANCSRILNLSSITYKMASPIGFLFDDYNCTKRPYTLFGTYSQSKLANILFTRDLARRYPHIACYAINPGIVRTDVTRNMSPFLRYGNAMAGMIMQWYQKTPFMGAHCSVWASTAALHHLPPTGSFLSQSRQENLYLPIDGLSEERRLWELSEQLVGWASVKEDTLSD
jgi:retinol dehydrogenase 12